LVDGLGGLRFLLLNLRQELGLIFHTFEVIFHQPDGLDVPPIHNCLPFHIENISDVVDVDVGNCELFVVLVIHADCLLLFAQFVLIFVWVVKGFMCGEDLAVHHGS
jgi:hypothetical protein